MTKTKSGRGSRKSKQSKYPVVPRQVEVRLKQKKKQADPGPKRPEEEAKAKTSFYLTREEEEKDKSTHLNLLTDDRSKAYITARGAAILELERLGTSNKDELLHIHLDDIANLAATMTTEELLEMSHMKVLEY
jgi:hypothetical protein